MKILFTGGGTAGHIFPIIAVSREIRRLAPKENLRFFYVGPKDDFAKILLSNEGIEVKSILAGKIRRYFNWQAILQNFVDILIKSPLGFLQAFIYVFWLSPDIVFAKGGYGSFSIGLWAWLLQTPVFLHESDVEPGFCSKILSKICSRLFVSFPQTEYFAFEKMEVVGNPIRREVLTGSEQEARRVFNLRGGKPVILILGGSQGARRINELIISILPQLLDGFEIIHQVGEKLFKEITAQVQALISPELSRSYHFFGFLREEVLKHAYAACDLVVSRAGAGAIFELAALKKPSILIPLSRSAQDHQVKNGYNYAARGAATVIEEANISPHFFLEKIKYLLSQPDALRQMSEKADAFARPEAAREIAQEIVNLIF